MRFSDHGHILDGTKWQDAKIDALPFDASNRRYWRLTKDGDSVLLMAAPPFDEPLGPYRQIANYLAAKGFSTPEILIIDEAQGHALIEDFGDLTFTRALAAGKDEQKLYGGAVDVLAALHQQGRPAETDLKAYDLTPLMRELDVFGDWYFPGTGSDLRDEDKWLGFRSRMQQHLEPVAGDQSVFVHRDYHVDNIMVLPDREGIARWGLLDFQDALVGSPAYDLMSLAEDARRDVSDRLFDFCMDRYCDQCATIDRQALLHNMTVLGLQRHLKVVGVFIRYYRRAGSPKYLMHMPRLVRLIRRCFTRLDDRVLEQAFDTLCPDFEQHCLNLSEIRSA